MRPSRLQDEQGNIIIGCSLVLLGFSAKSIIIKLAYAASAQLDAITLLALRMLFALPLFLLVTLWHNKKSPALDKKQWLVVTVLGLMGYYRASYLDFMGLQHLGGAGAGDPVFISDLCRAVFGCFAQACYYGARWTYPGPGIKLCRHDSGFFHTG